MAEKDKPTITQSLKTFPKAAFPVSQMTSAELLDHILKLVSWKSSFSEELQQLFSNRPSWIVKENSKAVDILGALAELQRWCDYAERQILGETQVIVFDEAHKIPKEFLKGENQQ